MTANATPHVSGKYGAPMGRKSGHLDGLQILASDPPFTLQRVRINSGGYDAGGAYWGLGSPLYWWSVTLTEDDSVDECSGFFRVADRAHAKAKIRELHPHARFFR